MYLPREAKDYEALDAGGYTKKLEPAVGVSKRDSIKNHSYPEIKYRRGRRAAQIEMRTYVCP